MTEIANFSAKPCGCCHWTGRCHCDNHCDHKALAADRPQTPEFNDQNNLFVEEY